MASPLAEAARRAARQYELERADDEERARRLTETERYARNPFALADEGHVWIYGKWQRRPIRLELYDTQRELARAWIDFEHLEVTGDLRFRNVVDEKSRQMGETWGVAYLLEWAMTYHARSLFFHHVRAAEIDDGGERNTWRSAFGKIRFIDRRLGSATGQPDPGARTRVPGVGRPLVFRPRSDAPARVENIEVGGILYGGEQTTDPGRGGTFDAVVVDEAAYVPWGEKVHAALDEACPTGKLYLSTPNGDDNIHARIADERPKGWAYLRHHWSSHPLYSRGIHVAATSPGEPDAEQPTKAMAKAAAQCILCAGTRAGVRWDSQDPQAHRYPGRLTSPWYDERVIGKTDEQVAQELDIDRERALSGRVYSEFELERHVVSGGIPYDDHTPIELAFDYGLDTTAILFCQDKASSFDIIAEIERGSEAQPKSTATPDQNAEAIRQKLIELGVPQERTTPYWTQMLHAIGDPSGDNPQTAVGFSDVDAYRRQGFNIGVPPRRLTARVTTNITAVKRLLLGSPKPMRICGVKCPQLVEHFRNNTWPVDKLGRRKPSGKPVDNRHNHALRALAYLVVSKWPPPVEDEPLYTTDPDADKEGADGIGVGGSEVIGYGSRL